jgi:type I restriction enzyme S subunit
MNAVQQLLTDHIDIWTAAETEKKSGRGRASGNAASVYGIKKLRELILDLAVRGKLVPQDANDEPARELIKRIQAERARLVAEKIIRKGHPPSPIENKEKTFDLPCGWEWVRLGSIGDWGAGATPLRSKSSYYGGTIPWFKSGELTADFIDKSEETVTGLALQECSLRLNQPGDVLIAMYGATIGKTAILKIAGTTNQAVCACTPNTGILNIYLLVLLKAMRSNFIGQGAGGAQPNISREKIIATVVALPPTEEQHRIVAKVDELMALCDQLEAQHSDAADAHEQLVSYLLGTLTQSQSAADFDANWQLIVAHFNTLFITEASIEVLQQTLMQLAIMGKLVAQDPNDEPACELLKRIEAEKAKLVSEGKIKKEKLLATIGMDEKPFDLPENWEWVRLGTLVEKSGAGWSPSCEGHARVGDSWGILKVSAVSWGEFLPDENKALPKTLEPRLDCVVESGDFLITRANTDELVARSVVVENCPPNLMLSDKIVRLRLSLLCNNKFINLVNLSPFSRNYYALAAGGTSSSMKNVTREQILNLVVGMPPLAEQHRIVAKVDELMIFCDQLKSRITTANKQQKKLADVLVEHAVVG